MVGYESQFGRGLYYNCIAGTDLVHATLELAGIVFVDVMLYRCLCVYPGGRDYLEYVQEHCASYIPPSRKAFWQATLAAAATGEGGGVPAMCKTYLHGIEDRLVGVYDEWFTHAEESVTALASFLDEVLVPTAHPGGCANIVSNPTAIVLTPLPLAHFQVCAKTTACAALCADSIGLFQYELRRVSSAGYNPTAPPFSFDLSVESPFFNRYASGTAAIGGTLLALASLPVTNASANCRIRCGGGESRCMATLLAPQGQPLRVDFFCIPDPAMILSTIFPMGLDQFTLAESDTMQSTQGYTFTHADIVWEEGLSLYVLVYASRMTTEASLMDDVLTTGRIADVTASHEVFVWRPDGPGSGRATRSRILSTDDLGAEMLTLRVQTALFDGRVLTSTAQVGGVVISNIFPVRSGSGGRVVLFLSFSARVQGLLTSLPDSSGGGGVQPVEGGYAVQAIVTWCDAAATAAKAEAACRSQRVYFVKCPAACATTLDATCGGTCNAGLDEALRLGSEGTFVAMRADNVSEGRFRYLHLSSGAPSIADYAAGNPKIYYSALEARQIHMDPYHGVVLAPSLTGGGPQKRGVGRTIDYRSGAVLSPIFSLSSHPDTIALLGSWTRAKVFSLMPTALSQKPVRDVWTHTGPTRAPDGFAFFFQSEQNGIGASGLIGQWLAEVRPVRSPTGWELRRFYSQTTTAKAQLNLNCTHLSCTGCATARLRLLCHQAQSCTLSKCVGTTIQTRNVLCGVGSVLEKTGKHAIVTWRAIHVACAEVGLLAMRGLSGEILTQVSLRFPTDQFYTLVCSSKDMFASVVGLGISVGNVLASTLAPSGSGTRFDLTGRTDVGILAGEGVLKSTSLAGLIFNAVSTATLLPTLAMHRWLLCIANGSQAGREEAGSLSIQFGDISMDPSWMQCAKLEGLQTILASNDMAVSAGDSVAAFVEFTVSLVSGIGETVLYGMQLSYTASIDYMIGLVWSIQVVRCFQLRGRGCGG